MTPPPQVCAVILAAGRGQRMGGVAKALVHSGGVTFLERIARLLTETGAGGCHRVVVGPPFAAAVAEAAAGLDLRVVRNPQPDRGMASSVAVGFRDLLDRADQSAAAFLWPVDHPHVSARTLEQLCQNAASDRILVPRRNGRGGHPAAIGRAFWAEMAECAAEPEGARSVIRRDRERVEYIDTNDDGVLLDIDRPGDLTAEPRK